MRKNHYPLRGYISTNRSKHNLKAHLILVCKYRIWRDKRFIPLLQKHFWKEKTFWTDGFFACSIGEANPETIKAYIENQG